MSFNNMNIGVFGIMLYMIPSVATLVIPNSRVLSTSEPTREKKEAFCWETEKFSTISECVPCSEFEKRQEGFCKETGNKQLVQCEKSNKKSYISCPIAISFESKRFWTFEAVSLAGAILSNVVVFWRRRVLNTFHYQRVKRQMSSTV